jgi:hypothetical protein
MRQLGDCLGILIWGVAQMLCEYLWRTALELTPLRARVLIVLLLLLRRIKNGLAVWTWFLALKLGEGLLLLVDNVVVAVRGGFLLGRGHAPQGSLRGVLRILQVEIGVRILFKVLFVYLPQALKRRRQRLSLGLPVGGLVVKGNLGDLGDPSSDAWWIAHPLGRSTGKPSGIIVRVWRRVRLILGRVSVGARQKGLKQSAGRLLGLGR